MQSYQMPIFDSSGSGSFLYFFREYGAGSPAMFLASTHVMTHCLATTPAPSCLGCPLRWALQPPDVRLSPLKRFSSVSQAFLLPFTVPLHDDHLVPDIPDSSQADSPIKRTACCPLQLRNTMHNVHKVPLHKYKTAASAKL